MRIDFLVKSTVKYIVGMKATRIIPKLCIVPENADQIMHAWMHIKSRSRESLKLYNRSIASLYCFSAFFAVISTGKLNKPGINLTKEKTTQRNRSVPGRIMDRTKNDSGEP